MFLFFCKKFSVGREFFLSPTLNIIQPIKIVSYGYKSFRDFKARIMLMEKYKIQKGSNYSYKFTT